MPPAAPFTSLQNLIIRAVIRMPSRSLHQQFLFPTQDAPAGFVFRPDIMSPSEEGAFFDVIKRLSFGPFVMHGVEAKRRIANFGLRYAGPSRTLTDAPEFPSELEPLRARAASLAGIAPDEFAHLLVNEYQPGAGIGWHRDSPPFGIVAGISLGAACRMRFQKGEGAARKTWTAELPPRSIYLLTGSAREEWQHSIPPVKALRYSVTFRTLRAAVVVAGGRAS
jgi:alkylated DNA repair dioxygenase AlkB